LAFRLIDVNARIAIAALLLLPLLAGCPSDRRAEPTLRGSMLPPRDEQSRAAGAGDDHETARSRVGPPRPDQDVYFISNINGAMLGATATASSRASTPRRSTIEPEMDRHRNDAPKGMAILGDTLYVADINRSSASSIAAAARRSADRDRRRLVPQRHRHRRPQSLRVRHRHRSGPGITFYDTAATPSGR
jgi:hypothetical protein